MNWSPNFCKFSPLRTPHVKAAKERLAKLTRSPKQKEQDCIVSDVESVASVTTRDIRAIARSVEEKMGRGSTLDSDEDLFITQSFDKKPSKLAKNKEPMNEEEETSQQNKADSDSDSSSLLTDSSESDKKSENGSNPGDDDDLFITQSSEKERSRLTETKELKRKELSIKEKNEKDSEIDSDTSSTGLSDSESEKEAVSSAKAKQTEKAKSTKGMDDLYTFESSSDPERKEKVHKADHRTDDSKETEVIESECPESLDSQQTPSTDREMRYKTPGHFEVKVADDIVPRASLEGKQIWLISAPDDFDISTLDGQTLNLNEENIVHAKDKDEDWEIACFPNFQDQLQTTSMCTLGSDTQNMEALRIGPEVSGKLQVMEWIPRLPQVQLSKCPPVKHSVPDDLKATFVPFGAEEPVREHSAFGNIKKKTKAKRHQGGEDTVTIAAKKAKFSGTFGNESFDGAVTLRESPGKVKKKHKKHTTLDSGNDDNETSAVWRESPKKGSAMKTNVPVVPKDDVDKNSCIQEDGQEQPKKKKKRKHEKDKVIENIKCEDGSGLASDGFRNSMDSTKDTENVKKKKKHKWYSTEEGSQLICDDERTGAISAEGLEKVKKKKHKKKQSIETTIDNNNSKDSVNSSIVGAGAILIEDMKKKKKKQKKHEMMEMEDRAEDSAKEMLFKAIDRVDADDDKRSEDQTEAYGKSKKKKKKKKNKKHDAELLK